MSPGDDTVRHGAAPLGWVGLLGLALAVRAVWLPACTRHGWEGHEAEYLQAFQGTWQGGWSSRVMPLLGWLYRGLGLLTQAEGALVALSMAASLLAMAALVSLVRRAGGALSGWLAGGLVALYGNHAFWSSSAYNVILPHALLLGGLALLGGAGRGRTLASGLCLGAAVGGRVELAALLPAALPLLHGQPWSRRVLWAVAVAAVALPALLPLASGGAHPAGIWAEILPSLEQNLWPPLFLAPWDRPVPLALALTLAAVGLRRRSHTAWPLVLLLVLGQLSAACFADSGFRHALTAGVALCGLQALGLAAMLAWAREHGGRARLLFGIGAAVGLAGVLLPLLADTAALARRYYAPAEQLIAELSAAAPGPWDPAAAVGCRTLITSPTRQPGEDGPLEVARGHGCWLWEEDWQHRRWTSLGVHDRAVRVKRLFAPIPLGLRTDLADQGRPPRLVWRIERP
ncbi:MAG: hypothetical protein ABIO70_31330 [Pseudomonadota bacterium]